MPHTYDYPAAPGLSVALTEEGLYMAYDDHNLCLNAFGQTAAEALEALEEKISFARRALFGSDEAW